MKNQNILIKASQQALAEALGFDEAQVYYYILTKNESQIDKDYSYSKKYRVMKSLFEAGAVGKFKPKEKDFFNYFLLPPSFLSLEEVESDIVSYLEALYLDNHAELLKQGLSQIILRDERPILLFLLKHFMKDSAKIVVGDLNIKKMLGEKSKRIDMINKDESLKSGIIDKKLAYEFVRIPALKEREYIGYISESFACETIYH